MKAQVTRPDGTTIEIEGKPAEVRDVLVALAETPEPVYVPYYPPPISVPSPFWVEPYYPREPSYPWTLTTGTISVTAADGDSPVSSSTTVEA